MKDFDDFINTPDISPPVKFKAPLLSVVHKDLHPTSIHLLTKTLGVHLFAGTATLSICPQFGMSYGFAKTSASWMMAWGHSTCMLICGSIFLGLTALLSSWFLSRDEIRVIREGYGWTWFAIAFLSVGGFACFARGVLSFLTAYWIIGGFLGGLALFEIGFWLRQKLFQRMLSI